MATRRKARKATPKRKPAATSAVRRALAERDEALKFQAATGEILKVIRRSTSDTQPVFEMIVRNAVSLCNGFFASAFRFDGERLHLVATSIVDPAARKFLAGQYPRPPDKAQMSGRAILARKVVRMEDALADPLYDRRHAEIGSWRRMLGVPMMDRGEPIGVIVVSWTDAGPIPKAQEELLKSFADQAVIAIENARLFKEVRERNAELKQSLDFQGATGGILTSISRSVTDAQPVFEAIVDSVLRLFGTRYAAVFLIRGEELHLAASKGDPDFEKRRLAVFRQFRASFPQRIDWSGFTGKALRAGVVSQIAPIIGNPEATPQAVQLAKDFGYNAMLLAPLMREGKAIGAIGTTRPEGEPFDAKQLALFEAFAAQAVIAIENARLFNETKEALERQTGTAQVLSAISGSPTDVAPVHQAILENATRLCEASFASVFLYDGEYLKAVAHLGASPAFAKHLDENRLRPSRETATRRAALEKRIVQVEDLLNDPEFAPGQAHRAENARTVLSVPMLREGALVGVITVWRREPRRFSDQQVGLLKTFADQAVIAIENVRLFNETREALEKQTATAEILRVISSTPTDATPVFEAIVRNSTRLCEAAYANVFRYDGERLHWAASDGWPAELLAELKAAYPTTPNRSRVAGRVILEGRAVRLEDTHADSEYDKTLGRSLRYRRILGVPLLREDRTVGVITVGWAAAGPIERRHEDLLKTFADQAVIAIENVRLFNETKEALERQTATADILRVISSSPTNIQPVLEAVAATAARLCEAKDAIIQLRDDDVLRFVAHHGKLPNVGVGGTRALSRELVTGRAVLEGRQIHVHDLQAQANEYPRGSEIAREFGYRTILATPLMREGVAIGSIMIRRAEARPFTETQLALMRTFADQAVIAIENVRLFNETKEALEQQKASAEVLGTISSSIADTRPVFEKILESCERLFAGKVVGINVLGKDGMIHVGAYHGAGREAFEEVFPLPVDRDSGSGLAIVERRVVHIPDSEADGVPEAARRGNRARGNRASLYAPMMWHDKAIGVVWVSRELPGPFSEKEIGLLKTFADQAVIAVENARLFHETNEALERQTATSEVLRVISTSPTDVQPVFDSIAERAAKLCSATIGVVSKFDGQLVHLVAFYGASAAAGEALRKIYPLKPGDETVTARAIRDRAPAQIPDVLADARYVQKEASQQAGFRSIVAVPMVRDGQVVGAIAVTRAEPGVFSEKQVDLLKTFADQAVIAIENVRLFNETKEALDQQKASAEVLGAISGSIADTKPVFEKILASCERLFEGELVGITLADGDTVRLAAYHGPQGEQLEKIYPLPLTRESGTGWAILNAQIAHFPDIEAAGVPPGVVAGCRALRVRAIVFAPMLFEGKGIGAIWVARAQPGAFTDKQIAQLRTFADQAVIAIQNARLFNETKEALEQQKASGEVLSAISSSIADTRPVFDKILVSCQRLFAGKQVGINLVAEDGRIVIGAYEGPGREELERIGPFPPGESSGSGAAIAQRQVKHYRDAQNGADVPQITRRGCAAIGVKSAIFAPMLWEGQGIGVIFVGRDFMGPFSEKEIALLKTFADQAVIAIQNARLFREIQEKSAQLEVANKHKSDFLANMSHELRTPLNAIIGFSEVLIERMFGEVNEKQAEYLKDIHESGRHLLSLINDILDLSKIEAGRMELELSSFDLPGAVSNAMTLVRERAQRHGIQLGLDMDPRLGEFQADERKVKQILLNLLSNAVKFTPDGGRVDVSAKLDTDKVQIAVKDTGVGIAPEDHAAVFEEFKQVGRDYTRKAEGTGLGLALTKRLVELHGGEINLESTLGKGATFTVKLPLR